MSTPDSTLSWCKISKKLDRETTRTEHNHDQRDLWSSLHYPTINNAADTTLSTISNRLQISRKTVMVLLRSSGVSIEVWVPGTDPVSPFLHTVDLLHDVSNR